jgi:tetratricopeptide (TPR) repeat protein
LLGQLYPLMALGDWDLVLAQASELPEENISIARGGFLSALAVLPQILLARGDLEGAKRPLELFEDARDSDDLQERSNYALGTALIALAEGRPADALVHAKAAMGLAEAQGWGGETAKEGFVAAVEANLALGEPAKAEELISFVEGLPRGYVPQMIRAHSSRFRARLAAMEGATDRAEQEFKGAAGSFREMATPFPLAVTQLEFGEWLRLEGRADEAAPLLSEARNTFERLGANPWLERLDRATVGMPVLEEADR